MAPRQSMYDAEGEKKEHALERRTTPYVCLGFQVLLMIDRGISTSPL